jgi:hypothetical protein
MRTARTLLLALITPTLLTGCEIVEKTPPSTAAEAPTDVLGRPAYAARSLQIEHGLQARLLEVTRWSQARAAAIRTEVQDALAELPVPSRLATRETYLTSLRRADVKAYEAAVSAAYDEAVAELDALHDEAMVRAVAISSSLAPERSPLDAGATGSASLDRQVTAFEETLRIDLARPELEAEGYRRALRRTELLQVFSSFNFEGADEALGGRLLVFVGSEEQGLPRADVVFRADEGTSSEDRGLVQAVRFRIMVGEIIIKDLGWLPLPSPSGLPSVALDGRYIVAPNVGPSLIDQVGSLESLSEHRIVADVQTAVFDREGVVLGGADWRLEYRVSLRGQASWQPAAVEPAFNATCEQSLAFAPASGG